MVDFWFWFATVVFFGTYVLIATEKVNKTTAALVGSSLMLIFILQGPGKKSSTFSEELFDQVAAEACAVPQAASPRGSATQTMVHSPLSLPAPMAEAKHYAVKYQKIDSYSRYANFDVIFTLAGMMILVNILSGTGLFQYIAIKCAKIAKGSPIRTMVLLVFATAILSAFLDNVTTVLLVAPVTLIVATQLGLNPLPFLMAETMASNIGGTATLIGDPPNLIIGSVADLDFMAFLVNLAPFVLILLILYCIALYFHYRKKMHVTVERRAHIMELDESAAITDPVNMRRGAIVMVFTLVGFLLHGMFHIQPCVVAMAGAAAALAVCRVDVNAQLEKIEWGTLFFFMGLFILVCGAEEAGLMNKFGDALAFTVDWPVLLTVLLVMWGSAVAAAIMNNVSFTAAMATIVAGFIAATPVFRDSVENQHLLWWGLALAVCLGGNGTIVGAAANLVTAGVAGKAGHHLSFGTFMRYGLPVTFGSMILASLYTIGRYYVYCR